MLTAITRVVDQLAVTVAELRSALSRQGLDGGQAYRADYANITVSAPQFARVIDQLAAAGRTIERGAERERKLQDRVTRLESSNGALMVDRQRGIDDAGRRAEGAWQVATDSLTALRDAGIEPGAELATLVEDASRWRNQHDQFMGAEHDRLEAFRCKIVGLIEGCQRRTARDQGLTPVEVGKLGRDIDRANHKALGR